MVIVCSAAAASEIVLRALCPETAERERAEAQDQQLPTLLKLRGFFKREQEIVLKELFAGCLA